jgi:FkbM family methyltransferase
MKVKKITAKNGLCFYVRPNTSDEKTIDEVVNNNTYEKKGIKIQPKEHWIDLGGNIGAFSVIAYSKGATVQTYEPDPISYQLLIENLKLNGFPTNNVYNKAVVCDDRKTAFLNLSKTNQFWRNSIERSLGGGFVEVECINFKNAIRSGNCVKMDIEGSEMPIIEAYDIPDIRKMIFEWSFDIDGSLTRYRNAITSIKKYFKQVNHTEYNAKYDYWQKSWFPPCTNVYCIN